MKVRSRRWVAVRDSVRHVLAVLLLAGTAVAAEASATTYRIVELPMRARMPFGYANGINAEGDIVGFATDRNFQSTTATLWRAPDYSLQVLPTGSASGGTSASGINDRGAVIGAGRFPETEPSLDAVMWKRNGTLVRLGKWPGGQMGTPVAINGHDVIVGFVDGKRADRPAIWFGPQTVHWLGSGAGDFVEGEANAVNESGMVVGTNRGGPEIGRAFRWTSSLGVQELGDLPGGSNDSFAWDVNDANQIVGSGSSERGRRAVMWQTDGSMLDLGEVPGGEDFSYSATEINNLGDVAGNLYEPATGASQGFIWTSATGMARVVDLVDPRDPLYARIQSGASITINDINDAGLIVGILETVDPDGSNFSQVPVALLPQS